MDEDEPVPRQMGRAEALPESKLDYPVAILWVPDPTTRSGWCDKWIDRKQPEQTKRLGFRG